MQFKYLALVFLLVLTSCGSNKFVIPKVDVPIIKKSKLIALNQSKSFANAAFKTAKINTKLSYKSGKSSQKLGLKIRIAKGEKIWLSADFLGIPVAKILIEKDSVRYYNKIDKTYFEGSLNVIKELTELDFTYQTLENIFTGDLSIDLNDANYRLSREDTDYSLLNIDFEKYDIKVSIYPETYKTKFQGMFEHSGDNMFSVLYKGHFLVDELMFPKFLEIIIKNAKKETFISMVNTSVKFDEELRFPFKIPEECNKEVVLKTQKIKK